MKTSFLKLTILFFFLGLYTLEARHILGGEVTYECIDDNTLQIRLRVYRDCSSTGADFDNPAVLSIYRENGSNYELVRTDMASVANVETYFPNADICAAIPTDYCVQVGNYNTTLFIDDMNTDRRYVFAYQRCCRSENISNIIAPDRRGLTLSLDIGPGVIGPCINGPVFNELPPSIACVNKPLELDFSATDPDGDELRYSFCNPLVGGGLAGTVYAPGDPSSCGGVAPNPACQPPYEILHYLEPDFSGSRPLGGNPIIQIDPVTGMVTGTPQFIGTYNYGLCVEKYRNGQLLFTLRRDFQMTITDCGGTSPNFVGETEMSGDTIIIKTCGDLQTRFEINNLFPDEVGDFLWEIDVANDGNLVSSTEWEPTYTFAEPGIYPGQLLLYGGLACERIFPLLIDTKDDCTPVSQSESEESEIKIFPNPANDQLWIDKKGSYKSQRLKVQVIDARGVLVWETQGIGGGFGIKTSRWGNGLYWLRYQIGEEEWRVERLVVMH